MMRGTLLFAIVLLSIHGAVSSPASPASPNDLSVITDFLEDSIQNTNVRQKRELGTILMAIKNQLREMIEDIALQALKYLKSFCLQMKLNLLKKLKTYTLADIASVIMDSITESVVEIAPVTVSYYDPVEMKPAVKVGNQPSYDYSSLYSLSTLLDADNK